MSDKLPKPKVTKACPNCMGRFDAEIHGLKGTVEEIGRLGITQAAIHRFVASVSQVHNESTISILASFVTTIAQGKRKNPKKDAVEFIRMYIKTELVMSMRVRKVMISAPEKECEWHTQSGEQIDLDESDGNQSGPVPPDPAFK